MRLSMTNRSGKEKGIGHFGPNKILNTTHPIKVGVSLTRMDTNDVAAKLTKRFKQALTKEREEDIAQTQAQILALPPRTLARRGLAILNLNVSNIRSAMGGTMVLELEPDNAITSEIDKIVGIRTGDIVAIEKMPSTTEKRTKQANSARVEGVILRVTASTISVSIEDQFGDKALALDGRLWVVKLVNAVTYTRMDETLEKLSKLVAPTRLQKIVMGTVKPTSVNSIDPLEFFDVGLNESQKEAIAFALSDSEVSIVHGPPGTGKTYTVIEIIRQLVKKGERVLVCGPSNISVDTILERLDSLVQSDKLLRVGHPARMLASTQRHSLDLILRTSEPGQIVRDIRHEIDDNFSKIKKTRSGREKSAIYQDIKQLRKEYRLREKKALSQVLNSGLVVVCTLHGAGSTFLSGIEFNTIIIDEVSQSLEPQCWIPIIAHPEAKKLVIAGDNKQLPPTIKASFNERVLGTTLFDRLVAAHGDKIKRLLNVQYRMNDIIMQYPSEAMYGGQLIAADSVKDRVMADLEYVKASEETKIKALWIDTQGGDFPETEDADDNGSKSNDLEAWLVMQQITMLVDQGIRLSDIGVISPYNAQVSTIAKRVEAYVEKSIKGVVGVEDGIEVSSVDGFQGREKNAIIISLVRSNDVGEVGFLKDDRRLNVAMTRPRRYLCVIGDMETLSRGSKFLKNWTDWASEHAEIQYPDVGDVLELAMRLS
ncbi:P-loop containing nucleoside triphosphate hydrolase protein [Lipomyces arxii]|uniref:P-loop containing nucleoside triphosphate hydrolase protein n=1 Tax=Lipomyces arxii TaxID=56418 RepID=UPI0034CD1C2E